MDKPMVQCDYCGVSAARFVGGSQQIGGLYPPDGWATLVFHVKGPSGTFVSVGKDACPACIEKMGLPDSA